jgi:arginine decarboxylase
MSAIRLVWGTATGPTELSAHDAALAEAGVADYNLVELSSVIPAEPTLEVVGEAPDLGPIGGEVRVVQSQAVAAADASAAAGIGWARRGDGAGVFYEVAGTDAAAVREEIETGLVAGTARRGWSVVEEDAVVRELRPADGYGAAVVLATYGESRPVV